MSSRSQWREKTIQRTLPSNHLNTYYPHSCATCYLLKKNCQLCSYSPIDPEKANDRRGRRLSWHPEVHEGSQVKPLRRKTIDIIDDDDKRNVWWSLDEEFQFRKERDASVLSILMENPREQRIFLREFSITERKAAGKEYIRRLMDHAAQVWLSGRVDTNSLSCF